MTPEVYKRLEDSPSNARFSMNLAALLALSETPKRRERRREVRIPTSDPATITVHLNATVVDVSKNGMRVHLSQPLAVGTLIQISVKDTAVVGEVRYCKEIDGQLCAGLQLHQIL